MKLSGKKKLPLRRLALLVLAAGVPSALLSVVVANTVLNHFFVHPPYLLDSGWYSDIVYHAGLFPRNPSIACDYAKWYFGVHPSAYVSLFSVLSYLQPLPRIEWYALFQVVAFLPFAWIVYAIAAAAQPVRSWASLAVAVVAALAFASSGLITRMIPYPHYEVAIAAYICLTLTMLVTDRRRLAWVFYVLALAIREDAGVHVAMALLPLVYLKWRGVDLAPRMRALLVMCGVGILATVLGSLAHSMIFHGPSIMGTVYLGHPVYGHLDGSELAHRASRFMQECGFLYYPLLATCVLALVRRDARYLLGWLAGAPWFLLNFLAAQPQKATFDAYASFPFVASVVWVLLYGALLAPPARRLRPIAIEAVFAGICFISAIPQYQIGDTRRLLRESHFLHRDRAAVHAFVAALGEHRRELGHLRVDYAIASLALEHVRDLDEGWTPGVRGADTFAFHDDTLVRVQLMPDLIANQLDTCTRVVGTGIHLCRRDPPPAGMFEGIATQTYPSIFAFSNRNRPGIAFQPAGMTFDNNASIDGWLGRLPKGRYELTATIASDPHPDGATNDLAVVQILSGPIVLAETTMPIGSTELGIQFEASGDEVLAFRFGSLIRSTLLLKEAHVRPR